MQAEIIMRAELDGLGEYLVSITQREFSQQGHSLTGRSIRSISYVVKQEGGRATPVWYVEVEHEKHMTYLNTGVPADRIPYTIGGPRRGGTSEFIQALIRWVKLRGIASGFLKAKSIAFAIATTMKREGMPTRGSFRFTNNGRRTGWLDHPIDSGRQLIEERLEEAYATFLAAKLEEYMEKVARKYQSLTVTT